MIMSGIEMNIVYKALTGGRNVVLKTFPTTDDMIALTANAASWNTTGAAGTILAAADNDMDMLLVGAVVSDIVPIAGEDTAVEGEIIVYDDSGNVATYKAIVPVSSSNVGTAANTSRRDLQWTAKMPVFFERSRKISAVYVSKSASADTCTVKLTFARNVR